MYKRTVTAAFYLSGYCIELPLSIYHELTHYALALTSWLLGLSGFPTLHIDEKYSASIGEKGGAHFRGWSMQVFYRSSRRRLSALSEALLLGLIAAGPLIFLVPVILLSPWWLWPVYASKLHIMLPSSGDWQQIEAARRMWHIAMLNRAGQGKFAPHQLFRAWYWRLLWWRLTHRQQAKQNIKH